MTTQRRIVQPRLLHSTMRCVRFLEPETIHGRTMLTRGVNADGPEFVLRVLNAVAGFAAFTADNDHYGEHDFGSVEVDGHTIF